MFSPQFESRFFVPPSDKGDSGVLHYPTQSSTEDVKKDRLTSTDLESCIPENITELIGYKVPLDFSIKRTMEGGSIRMVLFDSSREASEDDVEGSFPNSDLNVETFPNLRAGNENMYEPILHLSLEDTHSEEALVVGLIEVNPEYQRRGIASALYRNIEALAKEKGFRFLMGQQVDENGLEHFLSQGRFALTNLMEEKQEQLLALSNFSEDVLGLVTIKFLHPQDICEYVRPEIVESL